MSPRLRRILFLAFSVLVLGGVMLWAAQMLRTRDRDGLHLLAATSTLWGMHGCVILACAGLAGLIPVLRPLLTRRHLLQVVALFVFGYLACGLAPRATRILFDEHLYMQIGQTIAHTGRAEGARYAQAEHGNFRLLSGWVNKQPNGWPYVIAQVYRVAGVSTEAGHQINRLLVGLGAAVLFLALRLAPWSLPRGAPFAAGALFVLTPTVLWWGNTAAVEPSATTFSLLAIAAAIVHIRLRDRTSAQGLPASACLLGATVAFAAYFRPESLLVFPVVVLVLWSTEDRFARDLTAWAALAFALALVTPNLLHLWSVRGEDWGATDGRRFDLDFVGANFLSNAGYFFTSKWFPLAGTALALLGGFRLLLRDRSTLLTVGFWFALSWGTFVFFYAGGYHYGASSRYSVISAAPVALFMGVGAAFAWDLLRRHPAWLGALTCTAALNWVAAAHFVPTLTREAVEAQEDVKFVADTAPLLPQGSLVISRIPSAWLLAGTDSSELSEMRGMIYGNLRELQNQYPGGIYLHFGFWENVEPVMSEELSVLVADTSAAEIHRRTSHHQTFHILRLDTPAALASLGGADPVYPPRRFPLRLPAGEPDAPTPAP